MRPTFRYSSLLVLSIAVVVTPSAAQKTTGPKARYEMDVKTMSGMGMGALMGGGLGGLLGGGDNQMLDSATGIDNPRAGAARKGRSFLHGCSQNGEIGTIAWRRTRYRTNTAYRARL